MSREQHVREFIAAAEAAGHKVIGLPEQIGGEPIAVICWSDKGGIDQETVYFAENGTVKWGQKLGGWKYSASCYAWPKDKLVERVWKTIDREEP